MLVNGHERVSACNCLNVRIRPQPPPAESESAAFNAEYTQVYVGDEGISVVHPQVTLRTRSPGIPIAGTTRCVRYTSLTCLICHTLVYHVHQVVPLDVEGKDGPQLPTDDWVEQEVLKSANGWIEVHQDCIFGDTITQVESSKLYSTVFNVVVPLPPPSSPSPEQPNATVTQSTPPHPASYLSNLQSLFPPPPFTPSHPVFLHLLSVASSKSQVLRGSAEEYLTNIIAEKTKELELADDRLRQHVESLWKAFREGIGMLEQGTSHRLPSRQKDSEIRTDASGGTSSTISRVAVRDFVPIQNRPAQSRSASSIPRVSSLSASLATTSFHYPRAEQASPSPPAALAESPLSSPSGSQTLSSPSVTSSSTFRSQTEPIGVLEAFKRNMDQARDTAASFRYFTNLEADMARVAREKEQVTGTKTDMVQTLPDLAQGSRGAAQGPSSITNGYKKASRRQLSSSQSNEEALANKDGKPGDEFGVGATNGLLSNGSKGKRKVTFDVKPDVVTIKREVNAERDEEAGRDAGEMIFDLEDENSERPLSGSATRPLLPLLEHAPVRASRPRINRRLGSTTGLPESFSTLRPTSLPAPSHMRSQRGYNASDASHSMRVPQMTQLISHDTQYPAPRPESEIHEEPAPLDPREAEILKLVAADTPSHRGAWTRNSKAWQLFVRRQDDKSGYSSMIPEEFESSDFEVSIDDDGDGDDNDEIGAYNGVSTLVGSLPIDINPLSRPKPPLSLASYQPEAPIAKRSELVSPRVSSTAAFRKAAYAQRDRTRSMDPGALDFDATIDEEDVSIGESDDEIAKPAAVDTGIRGRKLALKILQARSELPEPGMWRSLA